MNAVVLVEGLSDKIALETLARRHDRDLASEGIEVVAIGGAQAIRRFLATTAPGVRVAGLCDAGEVRHFARALTDAGALTVAEMESRGFFVCVEDLEDELIRSLGAELVEQLLEANGDLGPFRTLQKQPEWRDRPVEQQLRRFMGSGARRKIRYARVLVEALEPDRVPRPLAGVLTAV
jgi:hypothetical protein